MANDNSTPSGVSLFGQAHSARRAGAKLFRHVSSAVARLSRQLALNLLARQLHNARPREREQILGELRASMLNVTTIDHAQLPIRLAIAILGLTNDPAKVDELGEFFRSLRKTMPKQFATAYSETINQFLSVADTDTLRNFSLGLVRSLTRSHPAVAAASASTLLAQLDDAGFVQAINGHEREAALDYPGAQLVVGVGTTNELKVGTHYSSKEPETVQWIEAFPVDAIFYDVGANIGAFSLIAAAQPNKAITVVSFEAAFHNFYALVGNLIRNQLTARAIPLHFALSDKTSLTAFNYRKLERGSAKSALDSPIDAHGNAFAPAAVVRAPCFALDDAIARFGLPFPSHIKIDVDGHETHILRGAQRTLADSRLRGLMLEAASPEEERLFLDILHPLGFKLAMQQDKDLSRARSRNNYFIRE